MSHPLPPWFPTEAPPTPAPYPIREEAILCPQCGRNAINLVRADGRKTRSVLAGLREGVRCRYCEARDQAVHEARFPGSIERSPTGKRARELVREVERLAADAADPGLSDEQRAAAREFLATALPPTAPELEKMRKTRANRSAAAKKTNASPIVKRARVQVDEQNLRILRNVNRDEDGRLRSIRELKRVLDERHVTISPRKIAELRKKL